jgi:predicted RNA-binding Zn-ribbon protein involved in translation (DUF1610 family)
MCLKKKKQKLNRGNDFVCKKCGQVSANRSELCKAKLDLRRVKKGKG